MEVLPVQTSIGCPWQNGIAERWVGSCRRELLDHVIALNEHHLRRLLSEYISYYHNDRDAHGAEGARPKAELQVLVGAKRLLGRDSADCTTDTSALRENRY